jgi:membrane dipeptidase
MSSPQRTSHKLRGLVVAAVVVVAGLAGWWLGGRSAERAAEAPPPPAPRVAAPENLGERFLVVDTHIDLPYRLEQQGEHPDDVSRRTKRGDFDAVRARAGGLDVAWMSIYVPAEYQRGDGAKAYADSLIDRVVGLAERHPQLFAVPHSAEEAEAIAASGRIALAMGMENGAGIEDDLENLEHFFERGVRYVTLTHSEDNLIADSSYSDPAARRWGGLSPFGRQVIAEMNRLGVLVDLSHVSDAAFDQAVAASRAPAIASHSSCRRFTPGFERNLDDARILALAGRGGVVQINFGSGFLTPEANAWSRAAWEAEEEFVRASNAKEGTAELDLFRQRYREKHPFPRATLDDVLAHIDHVVQLAGIDHVGFGSDFDGVGPTLPTGLEDVSKYPDLLRALLARGYSEDDVAKIAGGNLMRVWRDAEIVARRLGGGPPTAEPGTAPQVEPSNGAVGSAPAGEPAAPQS